MSTRPKRISKKRNFYEDYDTCFKKPRKSKENRMECTVETTSNKPLQQPQLFDNYNKGQLNVVLFYGRHYNHKKERQQSKVNSPFKTIENLEINRGVKSIFENTNADRKKADSVSAKVNRNIVDEGLNYGTKSSAITTSDVDTAGDASLNSIISGTRVYECEDALPPELPNSPVNTTQYVKELLLDFLHCNQPADHLSADEHQPDPFSVQETLATAAAQLTLKDGKSKAVTEATQSAICDNPPTEDASNIIEHTDMEPEAVSSTVVEAEFEVGTENVTTVTSIDNTSGAVDLNRLTSASDNECEDMISTLIENSLVDLFLDEKLFSDFSFCSQPPEDVSIEKNQHNSFPEQPVVGDVVTQLISEIDQNCTTTEAVTGDNLPTTEASQSSEDTDFESHSVNSSAVEAVLEVCTYSGASSTVSNDIIALTTEHGNSPGTKLRDATIHNSGIDTGHTCPKRTLSGLARGIQYLSESSSDSEQGNIVGSTGSQPMQRMRDKRNIKKRHTARSNRLIGKPYIGYRIHNLGKVQQDAPRLARHVQPRCQHKESKQISCRTYLCNLVTEQKRQQIFEKFWSLSSWNEKRAFVSGLVATRNPRKRRSQAKRSGKKPKKTFHDCFLQSEIGEKVLVCKHLFIGTLNIGSDQFRRWCAVDEPSEVNPEDNFDETVTEVAEGSTPKTGRKDLRRRDVEQWLELLPKVASHYCRASSSKTYVDSTFRSFNNMHEVYSANAKQRGVPPLSRQVFVEVMKEKNIGIHLPRKDQCDTCTSFSTGSISKVEYDLHIVKKDEARKAKNDAKANSSPEKMVITMDLQSVLLSPKIEASIAYYKMKLQVHNFTIYRLNDGAVKLYVWHEGNGGVTSNEFTTCVVDYIRQQPLTVSSFVLISDGCGYQNRNKVLSSALRNLAVERNCDIEQLYLERGHTMMEADSVHATLDSMFSSGPIYSPSDYIVMMRQARKGRPYDVESVDYSFFCDYEHANGNLSSIRPGKKAGDAQVTDIRGLLYTPSGNIQYKLRHTDPWSDLPFRTTRITNGKPPALYQRCIRIKADKFKHLQELKLLIPRDYHSFYESLECA